jgi:hypothetical protein
MTYGRFVQWSIDRSMTLILSAENLGRSLNWNAQSVHLSLSLLFENQRHAGPTMKCKWTHVLKNGYFGADAKFELYNGSDVKSSVEKQGGRSLLFPDMADRVSDDLYSNRLSIARAWQTMPIGNRAELRRWLEEVSKVFASVVNND